MNIERLLISMAETTNQTIATVFQTRVERIDSIFGSYKTLHQVYLAKLQAAHAPNIEAFERLSETVEKKQVKIANQLYSQAYILLTGAAEALLKDVFSDLLLGNFTSIGGVSGINFNIRDLQEAILGHDSVDDVSIELGSLVAHQIFEQKQPNVKINFQNVRTTQEIFRDYFGLNFEDNESNVFHSIHRAWQIRHCLVHTDGMIDQRFVNNVDQVGLLRQGEIPGLSLRISKADYEQTLADFLVFFNELSLLIREKNLDCMYVTK